MSDIVIPRSVLTTLRSMPGLISDLEGRTLANLAAAVPPDRTIVEVGAHRGLSTSWLAVGARLGLAASIASIDPWPGGEADDGAPDAPWCDRGALTRWRINVASVDGFAHPLVGTGQDIAKVWREPVGLWFHDADHRYEAVRDDYLAWRPHLAPGAWIAIHDYYGKSPDGKGGWRFDGSYQRAVHDHIITEGDWSETRIVGNLWIGRRG